MINIQNIKTIQLHYELLPQFVHLNYPLQHILGMILLLPLLLHVLHLTFVFISQLLSQKLLDYNYIYPYTHQSLVFT